ncbi:uncharacterized protein LOC129615381 [Condylostylus longicornis]|uniref:uncharacterized protein LOC129615381 n=1 Tax=Condylostylus longicornis TaxID=2530218 RepID=UPI00244E29CF|nr:uncharacterized protein LOC129615381 [Condylostylus longicornis]
MVNILKNLITILIFGVFTIDGLIYDSLKSKWDPYDVIKISKFQEPICYQTQKISQNYYGMLKVKESLHLEAEDLLHCEVTNPHLNIRKPRMVIHTMGSTSDPSSVTKFSKPTDKDCFSFSVKTSGVAYIYLYTDLSIFTYKTVTLGIKNNTKSLLSDNHRTCTACQPVSTMGILDPLEFRGFWISWDDDQIKVGKEGENDTIIENSFYGGIGKIRYIGIATPGSLGHSTWKIEEPSCPEIINAPDKERTVLTSCHKIFDKNALSLTKYSDELKLLKQIQALEAEFMVEKVENKLNLSKIYDYYYNNLDDFYFKNYIKLIKYCKKKCNEEVLQITGKTIENLRTVLKEKIEELAAIPQCSENGHFDDLSNECVCNDRYAGDGIHCGSDQDQDGFPDESILDCIDNPNCVKDNCPYNFNPNQYDENYNGIGDICEFDFVPKSLTYSDKSQNDLNNEQEMHCADLANMIEATGKNCVFEIDFKISEDYKEDYVLLMFSQQKSQKSFILSWGDYYFKRFQLDKYDNENVSNVSYDDLKNTENLRPSSNRYSFEIGKNYRIVLFYSYNKLQIRILDANGTILETTDMNIVEIDNNEPIEKICSISGKVDWRNANHRCY